MLTPRTCPRSHLLQRPLQLAVLPAETYDSCERAAGDSGKPVLFPHGGAMAMLVQRAVTLWEAGQGFFAAKPAGEDPAAAVAAAAGDAAGTAGEDGAGTSGAAEPVAGQLGDGAAAGAADVAAATAADTPSAAAEAAAPAETLAPAAASAEAATVS